MQIQLNLTIPYFDQFSELSHWDVEGFFRVLLKQFRNPNKNRNLLPKYSAAVKLLGWESCNVGQLFRRKSLKCLSL